MPRIGVLMVKNGGQRPPLPLPFTGRGGASGTSRAIPLPCWGRVREGGLFPKEFFICDMRFRRFARRVGSERRLSARRQSKLAAYPAGSGIETRVEAALAAPPFAQHLRRIAGRQLDDRLLRIGAARRRAGFRAHA